MNPRAKIILIGLGIALLLAIALRLTVGGGGDGGLALPDSDVIWTLRLARAAMGITVGASLALAGVLMQGLLRNPLASPDILGPAAGASLGLMLSLYFTGAGLTFTSTLLWQGGPALLGAVGAMALIFLLSQRRGLVDPVGLVLVGVVVNVLCGAGVMFVQYLMPDVGFSAARLLIGSLSDEAPHWLVYTLLGLTGGATLLTAWRGRAMDAAALSDDEATSVGVRLGLLRAALFLGSGVLTAGAVILAGPIGFVGLVCPHLVRLLLGRSGGGSAGLHRPLAIGAALAGATLITGGDALVKAINLGSGRMPLGVLTALIGGPALILLLRRRMVAGGD